MDLFCPPTPTPPPLVVATIPNPDFRTCCSLFRRLSLLPSPPRSLLSGSPLGRNVPAGVFPERAAFCPRIYERVPTMSSFLRRGEVT